MKTLTKTLMTTAAVAMTLLAGPSIAADPSGLNVEPSRTVKYDDLNLSTSAGAAVLYSRIRGAAFGVCSTMIPPGGAPAIIERGKCMRVLIDIAVQDVNKPLLTALHQRRTSQTTAQR